MLKLSPRGLRLAALILSLALSVACLLPGTVATRLAPTPAGPTSSPRPPRPTSTPEPLSLQPITVLPEACGAAPSGLPADGLTEVGRLELGFCTYGELDLWST